MTRNNTNIVPLNWIKDSSQYALIPGHERKKKVRRIKSLSRAKGKCCFTPGISKYMIDFIYRAVIKLGLREKKLLFSRGAVRKNGMTLINAVGISELDWDVGTSIRIPHRLNYNCRITLIIENRERSLRLMEVIVLSALLHIAHPGKPRSWCSDMSAAVITGGWQRLKAGLPAISKK